ncbi:MAG TPA: ABC transporter permease subunit [Clostridia bacterium]|nr:ABC transporter permease subunit [Clostridia bacterium]
MISKPLLSQSVKSNWVLWLVCALVMAFMISIINVLLGTQKITTFNIDLMQLLTYELTLMKHGLSLTGLVSALGFNSNMLDMWLNFDIQSMMDNMYYTIGCMLIPMIYVVITANRLIVDQVDRGSMAYVLSTPTRRTKVICTQILYLVTSIFLMFLVQAAAAILSQYIVAGTANIKHILLLNLASALTILAISGVCFLSSAFFNSSKFSYALGGGICVFSFLTKVLGILGDKMFITVGMGVDAMGYFNYLSILSLIDSVSIASGTTAFLWKFAILIGIALITYVLSIFVFDKKDLSL